MSYTVTATFSQEQARISGSFPIRLFVVNASLSGFDPLYYADVNQDIYGYEMGSDGELTATEVVYTGIRVESDAIHTNTEGNVNEVNISIPNVDRTIEAIIQSNNYLRGREVYIIQTYSKFLPVGTTDYKYIGESEDRYAIMKEKYFVDGVSSNESAVTFNCKPKFVLDNMRIPGRKYTKMCSWSYLSSECNYSGSINTASFPTCDNSLENCKERHNEKRFGGFPAIPRRALLLL